METVRNKATRHAQVRPAGLNDRSPQRQFQDKIDVALTREMHPEFRKLDATVPRCRSASRGVWMLTSRASVRLREQSQRRVLPIDVATIRLRMSRADINNSNTLSDFGRRQTIRAVSVTGSRKQATTSASSWFT